MQDLIDRLLARLPSRRAARDHDAPSPGGFRLARYFTLASLVAFSVVALALYLLQGNEEIFFAQVQREQSAFFARAQTDLGREHEGTARTHLLSTHEAAHVNLTRLFANVLWDTDFAPFVARAQAVEIEPCLAPTDGAERSACFAELQRKLMDLPGFAELDAKARAMMRSSTVFKIKVFDLRGLTVYSSEHEQIGELKIDNEGWRRAAAGGAASELTHRDRFSAFEGVVENRDLISSYIPVRVPGSGEIGGVFEIYSDVTPFLRQIEQASLRMAGLAAANQSRVEQNVLEKQEQVHANSQRFLTLVGGLLALLYLVLLLIVRNGQRIIDEQALAQEHATRREQQWYREKMAALATMAANVSHEVGNPLAAILGAAQRIAAEQQKHHCEACQPQLIVDQTRRISEMTRQIAEFAAARREHLELVDVNRMVAAMCDFLGFDRRFAATPIRFTADGELPARRVVPDHLNEVLMELLQACVGDEDDAAPAGELLVETLARGEDAVIRIGGPAAARMVRAVLTDARFETVRRRVTALGGQLVAAGGAVEIVLPQAAAPA